MRDPARGFRCHAGRRNEEYDMQKETGPSISPRDGPAWSRPRVCRSVSLGGTTRRRISARNITPGEHGSRRLDPPYRTNHAKSVGGRAERRKSPGDGRVYDPVAYATRLAPNPPT